MYSSELSKHDILTYSYKHPKLSFDRKIANLFAYASKFCNIEHAILSILRTTPRATKLNLYDYYYPSIHSRFDFSYVMSLLNKVLESLFSIYRLL